MIKTLKSELTLRPTYDELIGLINQQGDENRPPIENIIDRGQHYLETTSSVHNLIMLTF